MRAITKGPEPASLTIHKQTKHSNYANYADKAGLRTSLVSEQRGLCCYCMGRIQSTETSMKIEHWRSQSLFESEQLSYQNLLGSCLGGTGQPRHLQHCDTRKADRALRWNPANRSHYVETRLRYGADGSIRSDDAEFDGQLNEVLNLNLSVLKQNRKAVLDGIMQWFRIERSRLQGPIPRVRFLREKSRYDSGQTLTEFCQVAVWWLDQKLARMSP